MNEMHSVTVPSASVSVLLTQGWVMVLGDLTSLPYGPVELQAGAVIFRLELTGKGNIGSNAGARLVAAADDDRLRALQAALSHLSPADPITLRPAAASPNTAISYEAPSEPP